MQENELTPQIKRNRDKFIEKVKNTQDYLYIDGYVSASKICQIKHLKCGNIFQMRPSKFSSGQRCPKCRRPNHNRSHNDFVRQFLEVANDEYEILGRFTRTDEKTLVKHKLCGHEYKVSPHKFVNGGRRCPKCANNIKKTHSQFAKEIKKLTGEEYKILSDYKGNKEYISMIHSKCGHIWNTTPINLLHGRRCPSCNRSKGELKIDGVLRLKNISFKSEFEFSNLMGDGGNPLRFDFGIVNNEGNIIQLIEYDGEFHYIDVYKNGSFERQKRHDKLKDNYCKDNNMPLLRIPYWDFDNIKQILDKELLNF